MRTTLDIDDDILQAAKEIARAQRKTAGQVVSELARKGLTQGNAPAPGFAEEAAAPYMLKDGWYVLTNRDGVVVTKEMVDRLIEEADLEDAGLGPSKSEPGKGE
jgi:L-amino acid N-acyltransferase YncA